jgi:hypothetical protein
MKIYYEVLQEEEGCLFFKRKRRKDRSILFRELFYDLQEEGRNTSPLSEVNTA